MAEVARDVDPGTIADRLDAVRERIEQACRRAGRRSDDVTLIGVTKTFPLSAVRAAMAAGLARFGENRVQDLVEKAERLYGKLKGGDIEWHMIGHLQRNKAKDAVEYADFFHALDSPRLAGELEKRAAREDRIIPCYVQVNVSGEESKYGLAAEETHGFLDEMSKYDHIRVNGLMTIASFVDDPEDVRGEFRRLRDIMNGYDDRENPSVELKHLSMGMSNDFEVAIEEGATHVRIGSAIFGSRDY